MADIQGRILAAEKEKGWKLLSLTGSFSELKVFTLGGILWHISGKELFHDKDASICCAGLSPDARRIAFFMYIKRGSTFKNADTGLFGVDVDGKNLTLLTDRFFPFCFSHSAFGGGLSWSGDGQELAFIGKPDTVFAGKELDSFFSRSVTASPQDLYLFHSRTAQIDMVLEGGVKTLYAHAWSSQAPELLYVNLKGEIIIYNVQSSYPRKFSDGDYPSWSRDGRFIAFREPDPAAGRYQLMNAFGADRHLICAGTRKWLESVLLPVRETISSYPLWSPDNRYLLLSAADPRVNRAAHYIFDIETLQHFRFENDAIFLSWEGLP